MFCARENPDEVDGGPASRSDSRLMSAPIPEEATGLGQRESGSREQNLGYLWGTTQCGGIQIQETVPCPRVEETHSGEKYANPYDCQ